MTRFLADRLFQALLTLVLLSLLVFLLGRATGDPLDLLMPIEATREDRELARRNLGLDQPLPVQYLTFLSRAAVLDLGQSLTSRRPVSELLLQRLPNSLSLAASAMLFSLVLAIPLGVVAALYRGTWIDRGARLFAVLNLAIPSFWLAIVLIQAFATRPDLLPAGGIGGPAHYVLPSIAMSGGILAGMMRLLRSSLLEVLDSEFVKLARLKGLPERVVIWKHALRNALIPVLTFGAMYFVILITSAVVTETVFAWPGLGRLAYEAVRVRDFPVLQGVVLTAGTLFILANLVVDVLYAYLDPRIRLGRT